MTLALRKSLQHQQTRLFQGQEVRPYAELRKGIWQINHIQTQHQGRVQVPSKVQHGLLTAWVVASLCRMAYP